MANDRYTLWGTPHSLYAGKARSYLIKKRVPFDEMVAGDPRFAGEIVPKIGLMVIPVLETPEGGLIQDTSDIIDHCEARFSEPVLQPSGGVQRVIAAVLDAFGSNYLLPLAMHYRWTYRDRQAQFLRSEFARAVPTTIPVEQRLATAEVLMDRFAGFLPRLGVDAEAIPAMEESYAELLAVLEAHFRAHPYLLGGRPSLADFGMMAPLYAHLARDPVPGFLMRTTAPYVARWTERMNDPAIVDSDYPDRSGEYPRDDAIPETLEAVLRTVFEHWTPGLLADAASFNAWIETHGDAPAGTLVAASGNREVHPSTGRVEYAWRGTTIRRASDIHGLWQLSRAQVEARQLDSDASSRLAALLERTGGSDAMGIALRRSMCRSENVLVLA